jgi:ATP phosphoribosyltransferase regulatory subunit
VLHARPQGAAASRELLQFGAEIFGHLGARGRPAGAGARSKAWRMPSRARSMIDLADGRILARRARRAGPRCTRPAGNRRCAVCQGRAAPGDAARARCRRPCASAVSLAHLYGGAEVLEQARTALPAGPGHRTGAGPTWRGWLPTCNRPSRLWSSASTWPTWAVTPTTAARALPCTRAASRAALARGGRYDEVGLGLRPQPPGLQASAWTCAAWRPA